ncbi:hypothetical protein [Rhizobium halophytocola]|uniref:Uncharacterized protein n=1 Tax=Rhizobium halophytocola TaxID=735519 RepID=A0ABS4E3K2_9HYPH|nr:hypothetical protein [Rhizobium halophytocola]MBP1852521.1 hypothetical protein [Rhizobium halophytocola]
MAVTQRTEPRPDDVRAALERQLYDLVEGGAHRIYVAMDGARFTALPARLNAVGMSFRPLYRQVPGNEETVLGGPWLVDPYLVSRAPVETAPDGEDEDFSDEALEAKAAEMAAEMAAHVAAGDETGGGVLPSDIIDDPDRVAERLRQILDVIDDRPGAVFWVTDRSVTAETLSRHLRRINQMLVARKDTPRTVRRPGGVAKAHAYERVIFRHADPNVMMQVVPSNGGPMRWKRNMAGPAKIKLLESWRIETGRFPIGLRKIWNLERRKKKSLMNVRTAASAILPIHQASGEIRTGKLFCKIRKQGTGYRLHNRQIAKKESSGRQWRIAI